jgi:hypothetical protein
MRVELWNKAKPWSKAQGQSKPTKKGTGAPAGIGK